MMDSALTPPLSSSLSLGSSGRWGLLWILPPFIAGLLAGVLACRGVIAFGPGLPLWSSLAIFGVLFLFAGLIATALYTLAALLMIGCLCSDVRRPRSWPDSFMLGALVSVFAIGFGEHVHVLFGVAPSADPLELDWLAVVAIVSAVLAIASPFWLVRWQTGPFAINPARFRGWVLTWIVMPMIALLIGIRMQWQQARLFESNCSQLAEWVKNNDAAPGTALPEQFRKLAAAVEWVNMTDGRVVLLLETSLYGHDCWSGVIYSTGPIQPGEIGRDYYGRQQLKIPGLPEHFISRQVDDRHFVVEYDLG